MKSKTRKKLGRMAAGFFFVVYLITLAYFLFFSERYGRVGDHYYRYNLVPFQEIKRFIYYWELLGIEAVIVNILGNVVAFMPFGFFLPIVSKSNQNFWCVALYSFEFSLGIELIQLSFRVGTFDVDDLIMNTFGSILGYFCFCLQRKRLKKFL